MDDVDTDLRAAMPDVTSDGSGRNLREYDDGVSNITAKRDVSCSETMQLIEAMVERENMTAALFRVERNKGSSGIDNLSVGELRSYLRDHWQQIKEDLLNGTYQPQPALKVEIPKPGGKGMRQLGMRWVVDMDLEKFFDRVNHAVDRPWKRKFLGYSMTFHKRPRLKVAPSVVDRLKAKLRQEFRRGRGRNLRRFIEGLTPTLRGWINYFRLAEVKGIFEELDGWIRRKLRCILWRQWKRTYTRFKNLIKRGLGEVRAWRSVSNGRGAWWNSGASHMNQAFPKRFFDNLGLVSLLNQLHRLQCVS